MSLFLSLARTIEINTIVLIYSGFCLWGKLSSHPNEYYWQIGRAGRNIIEPSDHSLPMYFLRDEQCFIKCHSISMELTFDS